MASVTMTKKEKQMLEVKAKRGWKCFYMERDRVFTLCSMMRDLEVEVQELKNESQPDVEHLKKMFLDLYAKVGELCNCPICFELMTKDNTHVPSCGHLVCKTCKDKINTCSICRVTFG